MHLIVRVFTENIWVLYQNRLARVALSDPEHRPVYRLDNLAQLQQHVSRSLLVVYHTQQFFRSLLVKISQLYDGLDKRRAQSYFVLRFIHKDVPFADRKKRGERIRLRGSLQVRGHFLYLRSLHLGILEPGNLAADMYVFSGLDARQVRD